MVGLLRLSEPGGGFLRANRPAEGRWYSRDVQAIGRAEGIAALAPYFVDADATANPGGWPRGGLTVVRFPNSHLIYALTWFVLAAALIGLLWQFFDHTLYGKALRATAVNRLGARLMGISSHAAGQSTFAMAALIGALSGLLIGPTTTVFYDSGFLIGLKGFVAAVIGGLHSYPVAAVGALFVGLVEAFGSFWASAFKEVIVFTLILPILVWRSMAGGHSEEH